MKLFGLFAVALSAVSAANPECEVCNDFLGRAEKVLKEEKITGDDAIEKRLRELCKDAKEQDNRFCYYTGLASDSATTMHKVFCDDIMVTHVCKVGYVFPLVILSEFGMEQY